MTNYTDLVNNQIAYLLGKANQYTPDHPKFSQKRQETYLALISEHNDLLAYLKEKNTSPSIKEDQSRIGKRFGDLSDIPQHMLAQTKVRQIDLLEEQILDIIQGFNNIAGIDEIFFALYRKFNVEQTRSFLANKLFRMAKSGVVTSVKGKKGIYQISQLHEILD